MPRVQEAVVSSQACRAALRRDRPYCSKKGKTRGKRKKSSVRKKAPKQRMALMCVVPRPPPLPEAAFASSRAHAGAKRPLESEESKDSVFTCQELFPSSLGGLGPAAFHDTSIGAFLRLFEDEVVCNFLWVDSCAKMSDRYLLAMVYVYFRRASLPLDQYSRFNFFVALYLANDIEEDDEDEKYEIFSWALGKKTWASTYPLFLSHRDRLWCRMGFRAIVSKKTCDEIISMAPDHRIWKRQRGVHHGGAIRAYMKHGTPQYGRSSPAYCRYCMRVEFQQYLMEGKLGGADELLTDSVSTFWPSQIQFDLLDAIDLKHEECHHPSKSFAISPHTRGQ